MQRKASAVWKGGLKDGQGTVSSASGILSNTKYSFTTRLKTLRDEPRRIDCGGARGVFFNGAVGAIGRREPEPESISTSATLTMDKLEAGWAITAVHLDVVAKVPGASAEAFNNRGSECQGGLPGIEGAEREDYDGREAGLATKSVRTNVSRETFVNVLSYVQYYT